MSGSPGKCNPVETQLPGLPLSWPHTPFSGSAPIGIPFVPWIKNKWIVAICRPTQRSFLPQTTCWMDKILIFFSVLQT
jgi:hypothetical protein